MHRFAAPLLLTLASGCIYDEGLLIENLRGTVRIPVEATRRTIVDPNSPDGSTTIDLEDRRLLGPVYLGLYPSVHPEGVIEQYPHPEVGPQYQPDVPGDAYPYGGTTVGDMRFPCFQDLVCKVASGRFVDYDDMIDWFEYVGQPILDAAGAPVEHGKFFQQTCFDQLAATTDAEVRLTAYEDRNDDGEIDEKDLDFVLDDAGEFYVAEFTFWQQEFFWDQDQQNCTPGTDCTGFTLWGWMDSPSVSEYRYSTCDPDVGLEFQEYNTEFMSGGPFVDLLNFPAIYIAPGDYVASEPFVWEDMYEQPELTLDFPVQE